MIDAETTQKAMDDEVVRLLTLLAQKRQEVAELIGKATKMKAELENSELGKALNEIESKAKAGADEAVQLMEAVRSQAYLNWLFAGSRENRHPYPGIEIKQFSTITVKDEKAALIWATQNLPSALTLNRTKFDKVAKELELDFVAKGTEYKVQIASDLSELYG